MQFLKCHTIFDNDLLDKQIWASSDTLLEWRQNKRLRMSHNITILKNLPQNELLTSKKTKQNIVIGFDVFITVGIYIVYKSGPFLAQF